MLKDSRGQISAEFVLLMGLFLVLVLGVAVFFGQSNELTVAASAAREGVMNASNDVAYSGAGNVIRFDGTNMSVNDTTKVVNLKIFVASEFPLSGSDTTTIQDDVINNMKNNLNVISSSGTTIQTNRYTYIINMNYTTY